MKINPFRIIIFNLFYYIITLLNLWPGILKVTFISGPLFLKMSRLQSYIEESNLASGFIKELCYNQDGRIICSPFGNSIRLLAYDRNCNDLVECYQNPSPLIEIGFVTSHKNSVLTTRFSPTLPILASGCLGGQVCFYQPRF